MSQASRFLLLLALSSAALVSCHPSSRTRDGDRELAMAGPDFLPSARGAELFAQHCRVCHGEEGRGDGPGAAYLKPPARDFSRGFFQWVSTTNGSPSDADLYRSLKRGIPGSAMPAWGWLGDEDLHALVDHVRFLSREGLAERIAMDADEAGAPFEWEEALARAGEILRPGEALPRLEEPEETRALMRRGAEVYAAACALCHAADGSGERTPRWNPDGTPNWARDFTAGVLASGGSFEDIANRVRLGIPGTAMVPTVLPEDDLVALVAHVRSLIPAGAEDRLVHRRERITAARVPQVPGELEDPLWDTSQAIEVVLAPLRWRDDGVRAVRLEALHDGESIAVRAAWLDPTADVGLFSDVHSPDGFALQLSKEDAPSLFGMGAPEQATTIWHWQSVRLEDVVGALDLINAAPHVSGETRLGEVRVDVPLYHRLDAVPEVSERVEGFDPRGVESADRAARRDLPGISVTVDHDGQGWTLLLVRPLAPGKGEIDLYPGDEIQIACAVWNGSSGDQGAEKSISIWQELVLAP